MGEKTNMNPWELHVQKLDEAVAKVKGLEWKPGLATPHMRWVGPSGRFLRLGWSPSTNWADAGELWIEMTEAEPYNWAIFSDTDGCVVVEHFPEDYMGEREEGTGDWESFSFPAPEAITRAWLWWQGQKEENL